jgi:Flp pilus assembly protein TadD
MKLISTLIILVLTITGCTKDDPLERISRANQLRVEKKYDQSDKILYAVLKEDSKNTSAIIALAQNLEDQSKFKEALSKYKEVLEVTPDHIAATLYVGNIYRRMGDLETAIKYVTRATVLSPGEGWVKNLLAHLFEQSGDLEKAKFNYEAAVDLVGNDDQFLMDLAMFCEKTEDLECAAKNYTAFLSLYQQQDEIVITKHEKEITFAQARLKALRGEAKN